MAKLSPIVRLIAVALAQIGRANIAASMRRTAMILFITSIIVVFLVMAAAGCIAAAFWVYIANYIGPMGAFIATAGGFLSLAFIVLALAKHSIKRKSHLFPLGSPEAMIGQAAKLMREHKGAIILAALILGAIAGQRKRGR